MQRQEGSDRAQQQPRNALTRSAAKKRPWYGRALDCRHLWMQPAVAPPPARAPPAPPAERRPRWYSSVKAAPLAFARVVCLCAPECTYEAVLLGVHVDAVVPTPRGGTSSGGLSPASAPTLARSPVAPAGEGTATRRRTSFRGRSLTDSALIRRFVLDELATRRRGEMEAVHVKRRRSEEKWQPPGESRLRRMSLADDAEE